MTPTNLHGDNGPAARELQVGNEGQEGVEVAGGGQLEVLVRRPHLHRWVPQEVAGRKGKKQEKDKG